MKKKYFWIFGACAFASGITFVIPKAKGVYYLKEVCIEHKGKTDCSHSTLMRFGKGQEWGRSEEGKGYIIQFAAAAYFKIPFYWVLSVNETKSDMILDLEHLKMGPFFSSGESKYLGKFDLSMDNLGKDYIGELKFNDRDEKVHLHLEYSK
jgi:hypothetical protein